MSECWIWSEGVALIRLRGWSADTLWRGEFIDGIILEYLDKGRLI